MKGHFVLTYYLVPGVMRRFVILIFLLLLVLKT